jgi:hypothetical protein
MAVNLSAALPKLQAAGIGLDADFHSLSSDQVRVLLECAAADHYQPPKNASGSKARMYFYALVRKANGGQS